MAKSYRKNTQADVFAPGSPEEADNAMFSGGQLASDLVDPRVIATPTDIMSIWADVKQPRRAIPASIRMHWNGDPAEVRDLLSQWHVVACKAAGINDLDIIQTLNGVGEGREIGDGMPAIFTGYIELLRLAADIRAVSLTNPITVIEQAGKRMIETGERRWLAYHLLNAYLPSPPGPPHPRQGEGSKDWSKIPAQRSDGRDYVWRQASENTARRALNAIGMARQLALLIMAAREDSYLEYEDMVGPGVCDRRYYAQVADGNVHRIPRGMGERIQGSMGNLDLNNLRNYRRLLALFDDDALNDAIWTRADVEDWPLNALLQIATVNAFTVREVVIGRVEWSLDDLRALVDRERKIKYGLNPDVEDGSPVGSIAGRPAQGLEHVITPGSNPPSNSPHSDGGRAAAFETGEAVQVPHTGEIGAITRIAPMSGKWGVMIDGVENFHYASDLGRLGMTYQEFIEQELEDDPGVTWDEPDALTPDPSPHSDEEGEEIPVFYPKDRVRTRGGQLGTVFDQSGGYLVQVQVDADKVIRPHKPETLELVQRAAPIDRVEMQSGMDARGNVYAVGDEILLNGRLPGVIIEIPSRRMARVELESGERPVVSLDQLTKRGASDKADSEGSRLSTWNLFTSSMGRAMRLDYGDISISFRNADTINSLDHMKQIEQNPDDIQVLGEMRYLIYSKIIDELNQFCVDVAEDLQIDQDAVD